MYSGNERVWYNTPMIRVEDYLRLRLDVTALRDHVNAIDEILRSYKIEIAPTLPDVPRETEEVHETTDVVPPADSAETEAPVGQGELHGDELSPTTRSVRVHAPGKPRNRPGR